MLLINAKFDLFGSWQIWLQIEVGYL